MYVCPHCHEEIPDRVRRTQSECPFCREPWPPDEQPPQEPTAAPGHNPEAQAVATTAQPATGGPSPARQDSSEQAPVTMEPPKSKTGLWVAVVMVVIAAAGGLWWWHKSKASDGKAQGVITVTVDGEKVALKEYYEDDYAKTLEWYDAVRKQMLSFLTERCEAYQRHRFQVLSRLVERERLITAKKKVKTIQFDLSIDSKAKAKPDGFDWFRCPFILAYVHKEHAMTIRLAMKEKERVLGSTLRRAVITIGGGRFVLGKGTYKSNWDDNRAGLFFPMLKKLDPKEHPGVAVLSGKRDEAKPPKHLIVGGIKFVKVKKLPGKSYLAAQWEAKLESDKFLKLFREWTGRCRQLKRSIKEINDQYPDKVMRVPALKAEAAEAARKLCQGLTTMATGLKPWDEAKVRKGADIITKAHDIMARDIRKPLMDLSAAVKSSSKPKPLCGSIQSPSDCRK